MSNLTRSQAAALDNYITGNYGNDLFSRELEEEEEDGCDVAPRTRGHNPDDY